MWTYTIVKDGQVKECLNVLGQSGAPTRAKNVDIKVAY